MKRIFLPTLVLSIFAGSGSARAAEAPVSLDVGGMFSAFLTAAEQTPALTEDLNAASMSDLIRLHFKGSTMLHDDVKVSAYVRLEAAARKQEGVDEAYVDVAGQFGIVRVGEKESWNAVFLDEPAPSAFLTTNDRIIGEGGIVPRNGTVQSDTFTFKRFVSDSLGLQYRTPNFGGFQAGIAYHPRSDSAVGPTDRVLINTNAVDVSGLYKVPVGDGFVTLAGGYLHIDGRSWQTGRTGKQAWNAGATVSFGGVSVGGTYIAFRPDSGRNEDDYTVGAMWTNTPWKLSLDYAQMRITVTTTGVEETTQQMRAQAAYRLGPGVNLGLVGFHIRQRDARAMHWYATGAMVGIRVDM